MRLKKMEFALCALGQPSPYLRMAFPNDRDNERLEYLDMHVSPADLAEWKQALATFLRCLRTQQPDRRIVLKSPTHTGRLALLAEMFPEAKFVHIARDPYDVVPSTVRLWKSLEYVQALQRPRYAHLPEYIFSRLSTHVRWLLGGEEADWGRSPR